MSDLIRIIKEKFIQEIIDSIWGNITIMIIFPAIATYTAYLTDTIKIYAPFSYCIAFFIGIIVALEIIKRFKNLRVNTITISTELRLFIHGDTRTPSLISNQNIWRWYILSNILHTEKIEHTIFNTILFISFDKPINISTLKIDSLDIKLPIHEVKEYNNRFAIIAFGDKLQSGTLIITSV